MKVLLKYGKTIITLSQDLGLDADIMTRMVLLESGGKSNLVSEK
jgi:hypothetical protein